MEYSDLVRAINENNSSRVNELMKSLIPRLIRFLRIHMNASLSDAEDCAQETILHSLKTIKEGRLNNPERVLSYILTSCRNNYLKMRQKDKEQNYDRIPDHKYHLPGQLDALLDKERKKILEWCLKQLKEEYRLFIRYWLLNPDFKAKKVAERFNLSLSNTWTRKHRITKQLHECYKKNSEN